jgi:hypothetical protein
MLFRTLYYPKNKESEYQKRGKSWYKRKKGSKDEWYQVHPDSVQLLNDHFKDAPFLYQYSTPAKVGGAVILVAGIYFAYKKFYGLQKISK